MLLLLLLLLSFFLPLVDKSAASYKRNLLSCCSPSVDYRETTPADFPTLNEDNDFATTPRPVFTSTQIDADTTVPSECPKYNSTPKSTAKRAGGGGREADKYVFMCSGLVRNEQEDVQELALRIDGEFVAGYRASVTHVIVRVNEENRTGKTLKYLQGVAHRLWVVGYQWVVDCKQHGRLLPEEQYEALDDTGEPGPKKSRLRETQLFRDYTFNFAEAPTHISMEDIQVYCTYYIYIFAGDTRVFTLENC